MSPKNIIPALILAVMLATIVIALMALPGAVSIRHDILTVLQWIVFVFLRWVGNLLLTIGILVLFVVGPWLIPVFVYFAMKDLFERLGVSENWHLVFLPTVASLLFAIWPFLVSWIIMIPADWISRFFCCIVTTDYGCYMIYETPPLGWGIYALVVALIGYLVPMITDR